MTTSDSRATGKEDGGAVPEARLPHLQRVTTEYVDTEDRLRLSGELPGGQTQVLWLTQRLIERLVPHLCGWLEQQTAAGAPMDLVQEFAQQAAQARLEPQARVQAQAGAQSWLVQAIDLTIGEGAITLLFKPEISGAAVSRLTLPAEAMRQWLAIVLAQYQLAQWPLQAWPDWMIGARESGPAPASMMH